MQELRDHLTCPICYNVFKEPTLIRDCQHTFCKECINSSLQFKHACPVCRKPLSWDNDLEPNRFIANILQDNRLSLDDSSSSSPALVLKLSITEKYAPNWKPRQGVREIMQNWYDGINEQVREIRINNADFLVDTEIRKAVISHEVIEGESGKISRYSGFFDGKEYGFVEYNHLTKILLLTNNDVSLARRILLLGSSSKVGKDYLVGQFGEGLKIGILELTRESKAVTMHTNGEHWSFELRFDPQYGEKVLSVIVEKDKEKSQTNPSTCTTVHDLTEDEWQLFSQDFLFLTKPKEFCDTINGTLLLDERHKHKLFVKGFWICDIKSLVFGVNLYQMELDRDRRAVVQKHDIENKVADIWSKAITVRKDLLPIFYDLLMLNDDMISKAQWYITSDGVQLLANYFTSTHGVGQPVLNTKKEDMLFVELNLKKKAIMCPEPLYNILTKAPTILPMDELLKASADSGNQKVPMNSLSAEEHATLSSVLELLHTVIEPTQLSINNIEFYESNFAHNGNQGDFGRWQNETAQISRKIFDTQIVHEQFNRCTSLAAGVNSSSGSKCRCMEVYLVTILISLRAEAKCSNFNMKQGFEKVMMERLMEKFVGIMLGGREDRSKGKQNT